MPDPNQVVSGDVQFQNPDPSTLTINASDNSIINYNSFNIAANESVIINLPSANSDILNRVLGGNASQILGRLTSNGIVVLINQNGIFFGPGANIDVASLIASTRDITDQNFLNSKYLFEKLSKDQLDTLLLNQGTINMQKGGFGVLIAGAVKNEGTIIAPLGTIALAAGDMVRLDMSGDGLISVAIDKETASTIFDQDGNPITYQIENTGTLKADGGTVLLKAESAPDIFKAAVNLDGYIQANDVTEKDGVIRVISSDDVEVKGTLKAGKIEIGEPGSGKMFLTGSNPQYFYGDGTFYNFTSDEFGKEIYFGAGDTYTFKDDTYIKGATGYDGLTKLFSTQEGSNWYADFSQSNNFDVSYVALKDAYNLGDTITLNIGTNWGNSSNWITFHEWINGFSNNMSDAANYAEGTLPTANDTVRVRGAFPTSMVWDAAFAGPILGLIMDADFTGAPPGLGVVHFQRNATIGAGGIIQRNGELRIDPGITLTVGGDLNLSGGTFNFLGASTFVLNGTDQTITAPGRTFNNLTDTTAGATLRLAAGSTNSFTVTGTLTLQGASGNLLNVKSATESSQAYINPTGTVTASNANFKDINAQTSFTATSSINGGNNTNILGLTSVATQSDTEQGTKATDQVAAAVESAVEAVTGTTAAEASENADENIVTEEETEEEVKAEEKTVAEGGKATPTAATSIEAISDRHVKAMDIPDDAAQALRLYEDICNDMGGYLPNHQFTTTVANVGDSGDVDVKNRDSKGEIIWAKWTIAAPKESEAVIKYTTPPDKTGDLIAKLGEKLGDKAAEKEKAQEEQAEAQALINQATQTQTQPQPIESKAAAVELRVDGRVVTPVVSQDGVVTFRFDSSSAPTVPAGTSKTFDLRADAVSATTGVLNVTLSSDITTSTPATVTKDVDGTEFLKFDVKTDAGETVKMTSVKVQRSGTAESASAADLANLILYKSDGQPITTTLSKASPDGTFTLNFPVGGYKIEAGESKTLTLKPDVTSTTGGRYTLSVPVGSYVITAGTSTKSTTATPTQDASGLKVFRVNVTSKDGEEIKIKSVTVTPPSASPVGQGVDDSKQNESNDVDIVIP